MKVSARLKQLAAVMFAVIVMAASVFAQAGQQDELNTAVREASDNLNSKIPKGNKIVILNVQSNSDELSDYIISKLIENAVNDGFYTVVDRQQLDAIQEEQKFQMSGAVDDDDALAIGKFFGAQSIVSGAVKSIGEGYNLSIRALDIQTAKVQAQFNRPIASSRIINSLLGSGGGGAIPQQQAAYVQPAQPAQQTVTVKPPKVRKHDWYFAPKYQLPVHMPVSWGAIILEGGVFWESGMFLGMDFDFGYDGRDVNGGSVSEESGADVFFMGGGLSMGGVKDLFEQAQIVYGGSLGFWMVKGKPTWNTSGYFGIQTVAIDFLAPFIKLRWNFVEVSYRALIGAGKENLVGVGVMGWVMGGVMEDNFKIGLHTSQLMIGLYFKTSKMGM